MPSSKDPPADPLSLLDSDYDSAEDSDFDPSAAPKKPQTDPNASDDDENEEEDSDEGSDYDSDTPDAPPQNGKRKRAPSFSGDFEPLIQTRAQRAAAARTGIAPGVGGVGKGEVKADVDSLWEAMNSAPVAPVVSTPIPSKNPVESSTTTTTTSKPGEDMIDPKTGEKLVTITRTYEFAGSTHTESIVVPASSAQAQAYFSSASNSDCSTNTPTTATTPTGTTRRPPPKKRASAFDSAAASKAKPGAPAKINTLEKSRLDWAGFVDKEGIGDDLKKWNKGDKGYLDRQAFLGRVEENRDAKWKEAKK